MREFVDLTYPRDGVAIVTMSNPRIQNNGSWKAVHEIADAMIEAREQGRVRAIVLASGVPGHWWEHAWLQDLADSMEGKPATGPGGAFPRVIDEIRRPDAVVIAAISGDCSGGGAELGWSCDLRIAEEQAVFGQPEIQISLPTGRGGVSRLARLIGRPAAAELVLLGRPMTASRIYALGGINAVVPEGKSLAMALEWAERLASYSAHALSTLKRMLNDNDDMSLSDALANEQALFVEVGRTPQAIARMREIQARFDAGESIRAVYGEPREPH